MQIIKLFYAKVNLALDGILTEYRAGQLYYVKHDFTNQVVINTLGNTTYNITNGNYTNMDNNQDEDMPHVNEDYMDLLWAVTVAVFVLFGMVGALISGKIADSFGRKRGMIKIAVIMLLAAVLGYISEPLRSPVCLIMSRAFAGLHCGISISLASLYLAEIAPKKIRGSVGTVHQLFITLGLLWSMVMGLPDIVGTWSLWPFCFGFNAVPALVCLILFPFCPESPRYILIKKTNENAARKALQKLRGFSDVDDEIEEMRIEANKTSSIKPTTLKQLLTTPELQKPVLIAVVCQIAQQWSGINAVMSYSSFIFKQANVPVESIPYVIVGQGVINFLATIVAVPLIEKAGRRPLLLFPMVLMLSLMTCLICLNILKKPEESTNVLAIICIIAMLTYIIGFAIGLGPIPYIVVSELFRQESRAAAMSFSLAINWICNFLLMLTFIFIQKSMEEYMYILFASVLLGSALFFFFFLPETKNRTFDDIADSLAFWKVKITDPVQEVNFELQPMNNEPDD